MFYKKLPLAALVMSIVCLPGNAAKALAALAFLVVPATFSTDEVSIAIRQLNANRASDPQGLMAEHLRLAPPSLLQYLAKLYTAMAAANHTPPELCCGDVITIAKKGKDPLDMNNHRGITITSVLGKLLEHLLINRVRGLLRSIQHPLQFGFTSGLSPSMAALVCTEVLANNKDSRTDTFIATVDVSKAFDSVWHDSVLRKLYIASQADAAWPLLSTLMRNMKIQVRYEN